MGERPEIHYDNPKDDPANFEGLETVEFEIKTEDGGKAVILDGHARGHKLYLKRIEIDLEPGFEYEAIVDDYDFLTNSKARALFDKYFAIASYKNRLKGEGI